MAQACGLVPIVEPEVLIDGDYTAQRSAEVSGRVLQACVARLWSRNVDLEAVLLKPMMVMAGGDAAEKTSPEETAARTLHVMRRCLPPCAAVLPAGRSIRKVLALDFGQWLS